jgi:hypothetical protein
VLYARFECGDTQERTTDSTVDVHAGPPQRPASLPRLVLLPFSLVLRTFISLNRYCAHYFQFVIVYPITSYEHCTCHAKEAAFLVWQLIDLPVVAIDYPDDSEASMRITERN